jgi:hypothetical protein
MKELSFVTAWQFTSKKHIKNKGNAKRGVSPHLKI